MNRPTHDLILHGATVITAEGARVLDVAVAAGRISALSPELPSDAVRNLDVRGLHLFPGGIDSHVHFNEPGRADWEGIASGSRALAAGGATLFFDMPLNSHPPTVDGKAFDDKLSAARAASLVDFAFWGGLVPGKLDRLEELAERGVVGFKAFMSNSGIEEFPFADPATLRDGMRRAASLGMIVAVHAESEAITHQLAMQAVTAGRVTARDYLESRPVAAEVEAIHQAVSIAGETGCSLHIVHVSSGSGLERIMAARAQGVDVTCETCPHYLALTDEDVFNLGVIAKCAPPLRDTGEQEALWQGVLMGQVTTIGSDHSPAPPAMKAASNFFEAWGGISGAQHTLSLMLTEGHARRGLVLPLLSRMLSANVAARFGLARTKGTIAVDADADLALVDMSAIFNVRREDLHYRHRQTPYLGRDLVGQVKETWLRGQTIYRDGEVMPMRAGGKLVRGGRARRSL